jgi:hypothetical protein
MLVAISLAAVGCAVVFFATNHASRAMVAVMTAFGAALRLRFRLQLLRLLPVRSTAHFTRIGRNSVVRVAFVVVVDIVVVTRHPLRTLHGIR